MFDPPYALKFFIFLTSQLVRQNETIYDSYLGTLYFFWMCLKCVINGIITVFQNYIVIHPWGEE